MLSVNNICGFAPDTTGESPEPPASAVSASRSSDDEAPVVDTGLISSLPANVSLGSQITDRLIVVAYFNTDFNTGVIPDDTVLTLGGVEMTMIPTISGPTTLLKDLSGNPQTNGYNCTFFYLQNDSDLEAELARTGGTTGGSFIVFRIIGWSVEAPVASSGVGTTTTLVSSLSRTVNITENRAMIAAAYSFPTAVGGISHTYTGAEQVLSGNVSAAIRHASSSEIGHVVTVTQNVTSDLFLIVGTWG